MADIRTQERILTCSEIKFLTPPVSPGLERTKLKTFTPPLTPTFRRRKSKSNIDLSFKSNRKENVSVFPYLEKEKKDWLLAAASNNESSISKLLDSSPELVALTDPYTGYNVLHWAAKHDNDDLLKMLLNKKSSRHVSEDEINRKSNGGYTPLHLAAINKSQKAFSSLMMDFKADRKVRDHSGKCATSYLKNVITSTVELKRNISKSYAN